MNKTLFYIGLLLLLQNFGYGQNNIFDASRIGDTLAIKKMLALKADTVNSTNINGHSALIIAAYNNQLATVRLLLKSGADVNYTFSQGAAIHGAAFKGYLDIIKVLVSYDAQIDQPDQNGSTPLIYATLFKHNEVASYLFRAGADPLYMDSTGSSAMNYAQSLDNSELLSLFKTQTK